MFKSVVAAVAAGALWAGQALASPIFYEVENLGGDRWRYSYTVGNETSDPIESFRIYFDFGLYEFALVEVEVDGIPAFAVDPADYSAPSGWDVFVAPTDEIFGLELDGFYDAWFLDMPLAPGSLLAGFRVDFRYVGEGMPGSQFFELLDEFGLEVLGSGFTRPLAAVGVREPGTLGLLVLGLLAGMHRRARARGAAAS